MEFEIKGLFEIYSFIFCLHNAFYNFLTHITFLKLWWIFNNWNNYYLSHFVIYFTEINDGWKEVILMSILLNGGIIIEEWNI